MSHLEHLKAYQNTEFMEFVNASGRKQQQPTLEKPEKTSRDGQPAGEKTAGLSLYNM